MKQMNALYLHHHYTTDVLSFRLSDRHSAVLEGEVYVNLDQARRQAVDYAVTQQNEIARLVVHGVLHLVGYDDKKPAQKKKMTKREDYYVQRV